MTRQKCVCERECFDKLASLISYKEKNKDSTAAGVHHDLIGLMHVGHESALFLSSYVDNMKQTVDR